MSETKRHLGLIFHNSEAKIWHRTPYLAIISTNISLPPDPFLMVGQINNLKKINKNILFSLIAAMSPRCNTLPRATASPAMRYNQSRKSSAASSASTTPTATPLAPRRSSFNQMGTPQRINSMRRSSLSRTSPSPGTYIFTPNFI